jgi:hypothetical protein
MVKGCLDMIELHNRDRGFAVTRRHLLRFLVFDPVETGNRSVFCIANLREVA